MRRSTAVARLAVAGILLLSASCAPDSNSTSGSNLSAESYAEFRPRELQALETLERFRQPHSDSSYLTLDPDSGHVIKVWIAAFHLPPPGPGVHKYTEEQLRAGADEIFGALANFKALKSVSIPFLPSGFQGHINKLENLQELNLTSRIDDSLAASLATHPSLHSLGIFTPMLDPSHLDQLATLSRLQHITLGDTMPKRDSQQSNLTELDYLAKCTQLTSIKLATRRMTPEELRKLASLKLRKLTLTSITPNAPGPHAVRNLLAEIPAIMELEELELRGIGNPRPMDKVEDLLPGFEALPKLNRLTIDDVALTRADVRTIGKLTSLEYLSIRVPDTYYLPGEAVADLKALTNLRELHYDATISIDALAKMPPLPEVTAVSLRMPDRDPETYAPLKQWPKLRKAIILKMVLNEKSVDGLVNCEELPGQFWLARAASEGELPNLKRLDGARDLKPDQLSKLSTHPSLQALTLGTSVDGMTAVGEIKPSTLKSLQSLPWLRELTLKSSRLGKQHLAELRQLPNLDRLDLTGNSLTNEHVPDLAALANVKLIDLRGTQLTLQGLTELHELRPEMIVLAP